MTTPLLDVSDLSVAFGPEGARLSAVDRVSFTVAAGETLAIVGESGSGKSATAMALARLNEGPGAALSGRILLQGKDVLRLSPADLQDLRGRGVAMIFQDAMTALNPCETIGDQIAEALIVHGQANRRTAQARAVEVLGEVGLPEPARRAGLYPHEVSGGQRQRAMIAVALACDPALLIADEPTTALDVTIQAQILALLTRLVTERNMGMILITHDLGVVAGVADRVAVVYAGRIVLGKHGRDASPEQRRRFIDAFYRSLLRTYAEGLLEFRADNLRMLPYRGEDGETKTRVRSEVILNDGRVIPVDYSLRLTDSGWKAYDVTIEGISYLTNYRKEVGGLVRDKGLEAVISELESRGVRSTESDD